ncbi:MAG: hypothetical protein ACFFB5_24760 [Promethearchaeota archaeon]
MSNESQFQKKKKRSDQMKELTEFEQRALIEVQDLCNYIANEFTRLVDSMSTDWKFACYNKKGPKT